MSVQNEKHKKIYKFGITGSTDQGSGVHSLIVYALALDSVYNGNTDDTSNAHFNNAVEIARINDVDNTPSFCSCITNPAKDPTSLVLRTEDGTPFVNAPSGSKPKYGPNHIYQIEFDKFIDEGILNYFTLFFKDNNDKEFKRITKHIKNNI